MRMYLVDSSCVWHVAKSGSDSNSGHAGQYPVNLATDAKLTVGSAVSAAAAGDTVIVWPGDYAENVDFGGKSLALLGAGAGKSRIVPATGTGVVMADGGVLRGLSVEAVDTGASARAVDFSGKTNIVLEDCDLYGGYAAAYGYGAGSVLLRRCRIRGKCDGANLANTTAVVAERCVVIGLGTYGTDVDCWALFGAGRGVYSDCVFSAERSDTSAMAIGAVYLVQGCRAAFENCVFCAEAESGHTGGAYGVLVNGSGAAAVLKNCLARVFSQNATVGPYDLWAADGRLVVSGCEYQTADGTVIEGGSNWAAAVNAEAASALGAAGLDTAAKVLLNKAVQDKSSGAITYYDDDGQTVVLRHTPVESADTMTRTRS